jgi:MoaA/NifB/PqqE/SkfB family radical SAM enzyme
MSFFGEPMMHPEFSELVRSIPRERPFVLTLNTNWSLFTPAKHLETLRNVDFVYVSLDTTNPERYNELCPGSDVVTWNGRRSPERLATIEDKLERWFALDDRPPTRIVVVKSSHNLDDRDRLIGKWHSHFRGKDHILFKSIISYGGCIADEATSEHPCDIHENPWVTVAWDGSVSPCDLDVNMALRAGNLLETPSLASIMQSREWAATLGRIRDRQGVCANCFDANNWTGVEVFHGERRRRFGPADRK